MSDISDIKKYQKFLLEIPLIFRFFAISLKFVKNLSSDQLSLMSLKERPIGKFCRDSMRTL